LRGGVVGALASVRRSAAHRGFWRRSRVDFPFHPFGRSLRSRRFWKI